jgi:PAS domain S-box-containing protein
LVFGAWTPFTPEETSLQPWRIKSFLADAGLTGRNIFNIAVDKSPNSRGRGTVWVASSAGLSAYDGYFWRRYGKADGLPSDFVRCVAVTQGGDVWVGSDMGVGLFDGKTFHTFGSETNLPGASVRRIVLDPDGTVWVCCDSWPGHNGFAALASFDGARWRVFQAAAGLQGGVVNYFRDSGGVRWAACGEGIYRLRDDRWESVLTPASPSEKFDSGVFAETPEQGLVFSHGQILYRLNGGSAVGLDGPAWHQYGLCATHDGRLFACRSNTGGEGAVIERIRDQWVTVSAPLPTPLGYHEDIAEDVAGNIWIAGLETLVVWRRNAEWRELAELPPPIGIDAAGAVWLRPSHHFSLSETRESVGPSPTVRLSNGRWEKWDGRLAGVFFDKDRTVWGWNSNDVVHWSAGREEHVGPAVLGLAEINAVGAGPRGVWFLGKSDDGRRRLAHKEADRFTSYAAPELEVGSIRGDPASGTEGPWFALAPPGGGDFIVAHPGAKGAETFPLPLDIVPRFRSALFSGGAGADLWLYGDTGLFRLDRTARLWRVETNLPGRSVYGMLESDDRVWAGCNGLTGGGDGLAVWTAGHWTPLDAGIGFNLFGSSDGDILMPGKGEFEWRRAREPLERTVVLLPESVALTSVVKDSDGRFWAGNGKSVWVLQPDHEAPKTIFTGRTTNFLADTSMAFPVRSVERFIPRVRGAYFAYSWRLDDGPWCRFVPTNSINVDGRILDVGLHRLEVRARDAEGDIEASPVGLSFFVHPRPLQERHWFLPAVASALGGFGIMAFLAIGARAEKVRYAASLEKRVAERTSELTADIAKRKAVEADLVETTARFAKAFHSNPAILAISTCPEGRYIDVNDAFVETLGWSRGEVLGKTAADFGIWQVPAQRTAVVAALDEGKSVRALETKLRTRDGRILDVLTSAEVIEWGGRPCNLFLVVDITARRAAEVAVFEARTILLQLVENIREAVWLAEFPSGRLLYLSPGFERLFGRSVNSVLENPDSWMESVHPDDMDRLRAAYAERHIPGRLNLEHRIRRPDGAERWVHARAFPITDASGSVYRIAGVAEDVTERRELELRMRRAQRMEAVATLASGIAHDFNNVLAAMVGKVELAIEELQGRGRAVAVLHDVEAAAERAKGLIRQILAIGRRQPQTREVISLTHVIAEASSLLGATLPAGVTLAKAVDPEAPMVLADASQIHQVVMNLCTNAWHALGGLPGRIEIRLSAVDVREDAAPPVPGLAAGRYACLSVTDTGSGIEPDVVDRIFEPYFTTKEAGKGTGLGLSVVNGIVRDHDGVIAVASKLGEGSTFSVYLPAKIVHAAPQVESRTTAPRGAGERLLFLDDDADLIETWEVLLSAQGYVVEAAADAADALEFLRADPDHYACVITDFQMPGISGIEVARRVKEARPSIPVIVCSGADVDGHSSEANAVGIEKILRKPVSRDEMARAVAEVLAKAARPGRAGMG